MTITPVSAGSAGWLLEVGTDREDLEGVLMVTVRFRPDSGQCVWR